MSKPFELTVYPYWIEELSGTAYSDRDGLTFPINVDYWKLCKRLNEAELAAEWHKQDNHCGQKLEGYAVAHNGESLSSEEVEVERLRTLYRFATLPHHDEVRP